MLDDRDRASLESIADSLRRLADKFAPEEGQRERRPAILSTAAYTREEREREARRKAARQTGAQPQG